jgi:hypothetical protein
MKKRTLFFKHYFWSARLKSYIGIDLKFLDDGDDVIIDQEIETKLDGGVRQDSFY